MKANILIPDEFSSSMKFTVYFDGSCDSNKIGRTGLGVAMYKDGKLVKKVSEYIGLGTNNTAEYHAAIRAIEEVRKAGVDSATIIGDSELVIKQLKGEYKTKKEHLKSLRDKALELASPIKDIKFKWVPREENQLANELAQKAVFG